jgi:hypothetical protein
VRIAEGESNWCQIERVVRSARNASVLTVRANEVQHSGDCFATVERCKMEKADYLDLH